MREARVFGGAVRVAGPDGYCIDRKSLRRAPSGGFVLLASCRSLGDASAPAVAPVAMTVSVLPPEAGLAPPRAADLAASLAPRKILAQHEGDGVALVWLADGGDTGLPGGDPAHWRGAMAVNGHLLGLALYAPEGSAMAGSGGQRLMRLLAARINARSGGTEG